MLPSILDLGALRALYAAGAFTPLDMADAIAGRMSAATDPAIFISAVDRAGLRRQAEDLLTRAPEPNSLPLWGVPFAVKDNIDVAGLPTTAACPAFAYTPDRDAFVVARVRAAGAIVIGKTNLDQFATGLNGTRSPYGVPRCVFDSSFISGGSSSGSAVAVAAALPPLRLGRTPLARDGSRPPSTISSVSSRPPGSSAPAVSCRPAAALIVSASLRRPSKTRRGAAPDRGLRPGGPLLEGRITGPVGGTTSRRAPGVGPRLLRRS